MAAVIEAAARPARAGRRLSAPAWIGVVPFLGYVAVFLVWPVGIVIWDALHNKNGRLDLSTLKFLGDPTVRTAFLNSLELSVGSALFGAVLGAVLAYAVATGNPQGVVRRVYTAASGVLAQFGGVTLAFAFLVLIGPVGLLTHARKREK